MQFHTVSAVWMTGYLRARCYHGGRKIVSRDDAKRMPAVTINL
jgi:hypothetical protein